MAPVASGLCWGRGMRDIVFILRAEGNEKYSLDFLELWKRVFKWYHCNTED